MLAHGRDSDGLGWAQAVLASDPDHAEANALLAGYYSTRPKRRGLRTTIACVPRPGSGRRNDRSDCSRAGL